jgi:hypothetical protein
MQMLAGFALDPSIRPEAKAFRPERHLCLSNAPRCAFGQCGSSASNTSRPPLIPGALGWRARRGGPMRSRVARRRAAPGRAPSRRSRGAGALGTRALPTSIRRTAAGRFSALLLGRRSGHRLGRRAVEAGIYWGEIARVVRERLQLCVAELALSVRGQSLGPAAFRTIVAL